MRIRTATAGPALLLVAAACSAAAQPSATPDVIGDGDSPGTLITIPNEGGNREGHTPTAFAGMGTGLFAGDNLNPSFPDGVGVQIYLSFALPAADLPPVARITSDALSISGSPFEDLGPLLAEPVAYTEFGPPLFDLEASGPAVECERPAPGSVSCDVSDAVAAAAGRTEAQFRLRFEIPADVDGQQDLAMFFRTDSNTNEPGIFELQLTTDD